MAAPLKILAIVPEPVDAAWSSAAAAAWASVEAGLQRETYAGRIAVVRLKPATANALEDALQRETFDVVHVVARATSRPAAKYGTVTLEASDRRARDLNAQNFAKLCARATDLVLVMLQPVGGAPTDLDVLRDTLFQVTSVVCAPPAFVAHESSAGAPFTETFYTSLAAGKSVHDAFAIATRNPTSLLTGAPPRSGDARLLLRERQASTGQAGPARQESAHPPAAAPSPPDDAADEARRTIEHKRATGAFDVFLCHKDDDKSAVIDIGRRLMARGVLPWLDQWELRPGVPWQRVLEEQIASIKSAAVFVGREGIGPWQRQELDGFLREFTKRQCPVIPVMLPGAGGAPELPLFLRGMMWVDFRVADPDPMERLLWGITGQRPSDSR
jgi:hypothetical protein